MIDYDALMTKFGGSPEPTAPAWAQGLSRKDQAEIKMKMNQEGRKRLADLQHDISTGAPILDDLNEFGRLNRENSTGSWWQQLTPDKQMFRSPGSMDMTAIQSRLGPSQRTQGSGSSSDIDVKLFLKGIPSTNNYGNVNKGIREDFQRKYDLALQKSNAMKSHLDTYGDLSDFDAQWAQRKMPTAQTQEARVATPSNDAVNMLKMNPKLAADYDEKYGAGSSAKVLLSKIRER